MKTVRLTPDGLDRQLDELVDELRRSGREAVLSVTIAEDSERITPAEAGQRLGFSRQHVMRLVAAGDLEGHRLEGSSHWRIPVASVLAFEQRRHDAAREFDDWSRGLDEAGAPLV